MTMSHRHSCRSTEHALSRRLFLQGLAGGSLAFGGFSGLFAADSAADAARRQKRVILVFMSGGPSQFETWDPKPGTTTGGPHLSIPTSVPGVHIDEFMPNLARLANRIAIVRSMTSQFGEHAEGGVYAQSATRPSPVVAKAPHWLSICAHQLPATHSGLPAYVMLGQEQGEFAAPGSGFLGAAYQPLLCPGNGQPPQDMPAGAEDPAALTVREELRRAASGRFAIQRDADAIAAHEIGYQRMGALLTGRKLFDLHQESIEDRERYGKSRLGRDCLLARRLVENGVPFVRVQHQNGLAWDKHRRAFESQRHITAEFDTAVGALVDDLIARGLWDSTLLVLMGEFGRTPEIQGQGPPGRNHWTKSWSLSLGGCGIRGGAVIGSTNAEGTAVKDRPITIPDLFCTFYKALGINPRKELKFQNRPSPLIEDKLGQPIAELF